VFLDLRASPAPTSAGDVYLRTHALLAHGWRIEREDDGLVLLRRDGEAPPVATTPPLPLRTSSGVLTPSPVVTAQAGPPETTAPTLLGAALVPSPDGALDVDGPRWILRTTWQIDRPLPPGTRPDFWVDLQSGQQLHLWDVADVWWNPPDRWPVGEAVDVDVPGIPVRSVKSWAASWTAE
jgi:hypothetical protein